MDKEKLYANEAVTNTTTPPAWSSCGFRKVNEIQSNEQLTNAFLNPNWDNPMDQSDPFESALSSIVSSPAASNASAIPGPGPGDCFVIQELIGRLGNICNSSQNNNSTNTSCYSTPLNSPPKLNLSSMMDFSQIRGNLPFPGNHPNLAALAADPAFAERAARLSCFGNRSFGGQIGGNDAELSHRSGMLSRVSSNQSIKFVAGSQLNVLESNKSSPQDVNSGVQNKNFGKLSRASTPENAELGDSKEESSVSEQIPGGDLALKPQNNGSNARKRKSIPRGKAKELTSSSPSTNDSKLVAENDESNKRSKQDESNTGRENDDKAKAKAEPNGTANTKPSNDATQKQNKDNSKPPEPPKDYIHVRARRGQATDSHSLAERVRREKISERMKFLQDLVPGCNKVTGKAVMLDEIINYVQSLQRQVEFLSMKLATVNPRVEFNVEALLSKDLFQSRGCGTGQHPLYQIDSSAPTFTFGYQPQPLHSGIANNTAENQFSMNPVNAALHRNNSNMQFPLINAYGEAPSQVPSFWEDDLQSLVQMGFNQNQPQSFHGSGSMAAAAQMKVEL